MPESERSYKPDKYSMDRVTIEALTNEHVDSKRLGLKTPFELQGRGESDIENKSITVRFPKGDIFLSYITTIHELGHPRQEELDEKLAASDKQPGPNVLAEEDAWDRGWDRFSKTNASRIRELESKFQVFKNSDALRDFASLKDLYNWVRDNSLNFVRVQREYFKKTGQEIGTLEGKDAKGLVDELKVAGWEDFVEKYESSRVGEMVNEEQIRIDIEKVIRQVIK